MKLYVYVLEGKDLSVEQSFIKLKVGKFKSRTRVLKNTANPVWNEEFAFRVRSLDDEKLTVSVYHDDGDDEDDDEDGYSGLFKYSSGDLLGRVRIPLCSVAAEEDNHLQPTWYSIERDESNKSIKKEYCGKILLALSLHGRNLEFNTNLFFLQPSIIDHHIDKFFSKQSPSHDSNTCKSSKKVIKSISRRFEKLFNKHNDTSIIDDSSDLPTNSSESTEEPPLSITFEDLMETMESKTDQKETLENLQGGVLIDETYVVHPKVLNHTLFAPDSQFMKELAAIQGTTDIHESPWEWKSGQIPSLTRTISYTKGATKLVKASKVTEYQTYVKANGKEFAVLVRVDTPHVPYGSNFQVKVLYKIMQGSEFRGNETSQIIVSWGIDFYQSTMMKSMIEHGAKQGLKESFAQFSELLGNIFKPTNELNLLNKGQTLATLKNEHESDWELAVGYFCNFTMASTVFMVLYAFVHILLCKPTRVQGLEFNGLVLPDSFGEFITCGIILYNLEQVYIMLSHFVQARLRRGNDDGVKAQGEGWVLTVAIIEGTNLAPLDSSGLSDPYVVLTCNGKTRTSSVKLHTLDPQWNEILEFDAAEEPPSLLDVEVFDFDGPFGEAASIGHSEIRFLRHTSEELADMWVPLQGRLAQSLQSKLHLRIFLDNNNGVETIREYLTKVEKEAGKKLNVKSPHRNSTFQKLFRLPPEEFLLGDFSCYLKRKLPLQGRLFVSSRIVGFYSNLFGHKTKFSFLWEDVEDIHVLPPTLSSVGSPILVIRLLKGRGVDARHGAKSQDEDGRLCFYFHSFVSFGWTIMALWRTRSPSPDQKTGTFQDQQLVRDEKEDIASHLVVEDAKMSKIYSEELPFNVESVMKIFQGGEFEHKLMGKLCRLNYKTTNWEPVTGRSATLERRLCWKCDSSFGGDVTCTCTQQKSRVADRKGWTINEAMFLHDVPFGDHFYVQVKYEVVDCKPGCCSCDVFIGVMWLKSCKFEARITRNIVLKLGDWVRDMYVLVEREAAVNG